MILIVESLISDLMFVDILSAFITFYKLLWFYVASRNFTPYFFFHSQQADFDMLLVNLRMDSTYIKEGMNVKWTAAVSPVHVALINNFYYDA